MDFKQNLATIFVNIGPNRHLT